MEKHESSVKMHIRENKKKYAFLIFFFSVGVILGSVCIKILTEAQISELVDYLTDFFKIISNSSTQLDKKGLFFESLVNDGLIFAFIYIFGFFSFGTIYLSCFFIFKGFILGFTNAFLIEQFAAKGLLFSLVAIAPQNFIKLIMLLFISVASLSLSLRKMSARRDREKRGIDFSLFIQYTVLFLICYVLNIIPIILESYITPLFMFVFSSELL